jgi:hypothetical protein
VISKVTLIKGADWLVGGAAGLALGNAVGSIIADTGLPLVLIYIAYTILQYVVTT